MFLFPWHLESEVCVPGSKSLQGHADEFMSQYLEKQVGLTLHMTCDTRPWNGQLTTRQWSSICFTRNRGCLVESWKGRKKVWISKYRWRKNLAPVGMVATSWNTVIIHTMYMIYGLLWCQLLQGFCSSSTHFNAYCVFCRMFLYKISSHITMINVQFAKGFYNKASHDTVSTSFNVAGPKCEFPIPVRTSHPRIWAVLQRFHQLPWSNWGVWRSWSLFTNQSLKQGAKGLQFNTSHHALCFPELRDSNSPFFALWNHGCQILGVSLSFIQFHRSHPRYRESLPLISLHQARDGLERLTGALFPASWKGCETTVDSESK